MYIIGLTCMSAPYYYGWNSWKGNGGRLQRDTLWNRRRLR